MAATSLSRKLVAEMLGTGTLVATIIGAGIMAERVAPDHLGIALLGVTFPIAFVLVVIITVFGPISGAHFNPAVTLMTLIRRQMSLSEASLYVMVQVIAGVGGALVAQMMFEEPLIDFSATSRAGPGQWFSEFIATMGLIATILGTAKAKPDFVPWAVGLYIGAAIWFTASTAFANPAVSIGRMFTGTMTGILPTDVPIFIVMEIAGMLAGLSIFGWLLGRDET